MVALPESFDPDKTDVPQSGLELLLFRLSSQQQSLARIQSRAANLVLISLTMVGLHFGLLALIDDPLDTVKVAGVATITALLGLTGISFGLVFWRGRLATSPEPDAIIQRLGREGPQAMWSWSHSLQEAIQQNVPRLERDSRATMCALVIVGGQLVLFVVFSITALRAS